MIIQLNRYRSDDGFTLIELLVVILIIGILAAIALPLFLSQRERAQDTEAKSNARNMLSEVEACYADSRSYAACDSATLTNTNLPIGNGPGQVEATTTSTSYRVTAYSRSSGQFIIERLSIGTSPVRSCTGGTTGCNGSSW